MRSFNKVVRRNSFMITIRKVFGLHLIGTKLVCFHLHHLRVDVEPRPLPSESKHDGLKPSYAASSDWHFMIFELFTIKSCLSFLFGFLQNLILRHVSSHTKLMRASSFDKCYFHLKVFRFLVFAGLVLTSSSRSIGLFYNNVLHHYEQSSWRTAAKLWALGLILIPTSMGTSSRSRRFGIPKVTPRSQLLFGELSLD